MHLLITLSEFPLWIHDGGGWGQAEGYLLLIEVPCLFLMLGRSPSETAWPEKTTVIASSACMCNTDYLLITVEIGTCFSSGLTSSSFNFHLGEFGIPSPASSNDLHDQISIHFIESQTH